MNARTSRRTFVTHRLERGMPPAVIVKFTGHKDIKTLVRYVKIADAKKGSLMEKTRE
ncbi:tyrosine-type recombinase/integrase [Hymenobacter busanensis]|uniref:tyrosine-type recombinase/integrase n=1 Tax=Hymenobacter busanensis TaxID=2607656 RepID=UPI0021CE7A3D|nr:tyrosine-type recombinase/integrase [Hymenobacter busanensis]